MDDRDRPIRIGTRASLLAVTQTNLIADALRAGGVRVEVETVTTRGDTGGEQPIASLGSDGVFVRELEQALLDGRIDAAVHSLKDLPTAVTPGLDLACVPARALPFDVLVCREPATLASLPAHAVVGTSSIRRVMQVRAFRDDLIVQPIRGNVDTRLRKLDAGDYDALILAGAGLQRLGRDDRITAVLEPPAFWPAVGQGALVVQIRADDGRMQNWLKPLDDPLTHAAVVAERACLAMLAGGCLAPIGGWARHDATGCLVLGSCVLEGSDAGVRRIVAEERAEERGAPVLPDVDEHPRLATMRAAAELGHVVAARLLDQGAADILARCREPTAHEGPRPPGTLNQKP
jgi:hydroxymethylbilane synthase